MVKVDKNKCFGCAVCAGICPSGIVMEKSFPVIKDQNAPCLMDAVKACPAQALIVDDGENKKISKNESQTVSGVISSSQDPSYGRNSAFNTGRGTGGGMGRGSSGGGRGRNQGQGLGLGGYCVCPNCGHQEPHQRGVPCYETRCPKCNAVMIRM